MSLSTSKPPIHAGLDAAAGRARRGPRVAPHADGEVQPGAPCMLRCVGMVREAMQRVARHVPLARSVQVWSISPAIARLNISAYNWRSNCLHGWCVTPFGATHRAEMRRPARTPNAEFVANPTIAGQRVVATGSRTRRSCCRRVCTARRCVMCISAAYTSYRRSPPPPCPAPFPPMRAIDGRSSRPRLPWARLGTRILCGPRAASRATKGARCTTWACSAIVARRRRHAA